MEGPPLPARSRTSSSDGAASFPIHFDVEDFILFESRLSKHGAHYEEVARYPLA